MDAQLQAMLKFALDDTAARLRVPIEQLSIVFAEAVIWPDAALGCPKPAMSYTQSLRPGYRIRIRAGEQVLDYHGASRGVPFLCPAAQVAEPVKTDPRV